VACDGEIGERRVVVVPLDEFVSRSTEYFLRNALEPEQAAFGERPEQQLGAKRVFQPSRGFVERVLVDDELPVGEDHRRARTRPAPVTVRGVRRSYRRKRTRTSVRGRPDGSAVPERTPKRKPSPTSGLIDRSIHSSCSTDPANRIPLSAPLHSSTRSSSVAAFVRDSSSRGFRSIVHRRSPLGFDSTPRL